MNRRQQQQAEFDQSRANIIVGDAGHCPLPPSELAALDAQHPSVVEYFGSGLTAQVFRLSCDGKDYTLKKRRPQAKVANLDGQYSFLNEVQRRADFAQLKSHHSHEFQSHQPFDHIVDTVYADYRLGIILSPWIEGRALNELTSGLAEQLLDTLFACEKHGLMEWDLCQGNLLVDDSGALKLFDFGYMYRFDPLTEFNSNGLSDPLFHAAERFETRFISGWLLGFDIDQQLALYRVWKQAALSNYRQRLAWLVEKGASEAVIARIENMVELWQKALQSGSQFHALFLVEMFRSHVLDIEDDLGGKSCTALTLKRIDVVLAAIQDHFSLLKQGGALFNHNQGKSQSQLLSDYTTKSLTAKKYQIS